MNRILMISDIHGCLEPFNDLLKKVEYDPSEDHLILLGDYVDRGPQSKETVERVMELAQNHGAVALRGNHDQRLVDLVRGDSFEVQAKFLEHGGQQTIHSYFDLAGDLVDEEVIGEAKMHINYWYSSQIEFLSSLPLYHEDEHHIYVHAGLNPVFTNYRDQPERDFMYIKKEFFQFETVVDKPVIFGHTRTAELHNSADVWFGGDKIGIDGGCAYGMQLNCLIYEDGVYRAERVTNVPVRKRR
ncbi:metallophosphoesterase family protein [Paenibacillus lutrae]|uniref:Serine/threonine protein phosphatase n=1 Tax=Paenibacillus lutrae TaxID=2078573 RepID=A0A7X3FHM9_9BACL|nr:metallophosphoesterase family protein [Paenibacillus lutrae]MVO99521.1 serine/threonine protein phosphatase [Paenibacillus lutrae]